MNSFVCQSVGNWGFFFLVVGQLRYVVRLLPALLSLPHLEDEALDVRGVRLHAKQRLLVSCLPHLGAGAPQTKKGKQMVKNNFGRNNSETNF